MLRRGGSQWWLAVEPGGEHWALYRVVGGKEPRTLREGGRLTSPKHALQVLERMPASRKVPKGALEALRDLVASMEAGGDLLGELPSDPGGLPDSKASTKE